MYIQRHCLLSMFITKRISFLIEHTSSPLLLRATAKTESSFRTYPMSPDIEKLFLNQKQKEQENIVKFGTNYTLNDYVFKWDDGEIYRPDYITRKFTALLKKYGMPHIRFYDLRHSCASLLVSKGFQLKDIQEWLGHADIETTANIYGHMDQSRKKEVINSMNFDMV